MIEALERLLDHLSNIQDEGPEGEGWKSQGLQSDINVLEAIVALFKSIRGDTI